MYVCMGIIGPAARLFGLGSDGRAMLVRFPQFDFRILDFLLQNIYLLFQLIYLQQCVRECNAVNYLR